MTMGKATWGKLTEAWTGEATDFTPELARHLAQLDEDLKLGLSDAETEVPAAGGRRIDILAGGADGTRYVIENQYGRADHDHLTRGLAYAVSAEADGLIVVAEEHRDEFREVAHYLNDVAARAGRGVKIWLVEAKAIKVDESAWAPVFTVVAEPNAFTQEVARNVGSYERTVSVDEVLESFPDDSLRQAATSLVEYWRARGLKIFSVMRSGNPVLNFLAPGPAASGSRSVISAFSDGRLYVPFGAYQGLNSGIAVPPLATDEFRDETTSKFELNKNGYSAAGWFTPERVPEVTSFADFVIDAYRDALPISP